MDKKRDLIFGFEGMTPYMARWLSWLERRPVTAEVVGSSPIRVVCTEEGYFSVRFLLIAQAMGS